MRTILVERARNGDDRAFGDLVDLDGDQRYAIAYRILRDGSGRGWVISGDRALVENLLSTLRFPG